MERLETQALSDTQTRLNDGRQLILASGSVFRRELLTRLGLPFIWHSPDIDESPLNGESPLALCQRLAAEKATKIASDFNNSLVIGSDQVAVLGDRILGKPGSHSAAVAQLQAMSGQTIIFHTSLCLFDSASERQQNITEDYAVTFRTLSDQMIEHYLQREDAYQCAGSFKSEALGIVLCERLQGNDPTALIGLPLIQLVTLLNNENINIL